jgi:hypothetical protein
MTDFTEANPPAFPMPSTIGEHTQEYGMSLRDWFAGQALGGLLANSDWGPDAGQAASIAYASADAMLAERSKTDAGACCRKRMMEGLAPVTPDIGVTEKEGN